jgi:hypothetical protein
VPVNTALPTIAGTARSARQSPRPTELGRTARQVSPTNGRARRRPRILLDLPHPTTQPLLLAPFRMRPRMHPNPGR